MDFIIKDEHGNESAKLSHKEVEQMILNGKINPDTMIRNSMINKWNPISKIGIFSDTLAYSEQKLAMENPEEAERKKEERRLKGEAEKDAAYGTAFRNRVEPVPAGIVLRSCSAMTDLLIVVIFAGVIAGFALLESYYYASSDTTWVDVPTTAQTPAATDTSAATPAESTATPAAEPDTSVVIDRFAFEPGVNNEAATEPPTNLDNRTRNYNMGSRWIMTGTSETYCCVYATDTKARWVKAHRISGIIFRAYFIFCLGIILYLGISLGVYAQTVGMWFWGIFIAKENNGEVFMFRAFVFTALMIVLGWTMPLSMFMRGRTIYERLAKVKLVKTSGEREF